MSLFILDKNNKNVFLRENPVIAGFPTSAQHLVDILKDSDFAHFSLHYSAIHQIFSEQSKDDPCSIVIASANDAEIDVALDKAKMKATIRLTTAKGGQPASGQTIKQALDKKGISRGINTEAIRSLLAKQSLVPPGTAIDAVVAEGKMAVNGTDARFQRLCHTAQDRILRPQATENGKVDMRDLGDIITVEPGAELMRKIPATPGQQGFTVTGEVTEPKPGRDLSLQVSDGTKVAEQDEDLLVADAVGVPVALMRGMRVDNVITVDNVDVSTGHIDFDGSVIVNGDIKEGMRVHATGDITVLGFVESGDVSSKSALTVLKGVIGRKTVDGEPLTCQISSGTSLSIGYAQYAQISSKQNILIEKQALHCHLHAKGIIKIGKGKRPNGKLIGGLVTDALRLDAGEVGAPSGTLTQVNLAQNWQVLKNNIQQFAKLDKALKEKEAELKIARSKADSIQCERKLRVYLQKLKKSEQQLFEQQKLLFRKRNLATRKLNVLLKSSRLTVHQKMHPGVELRIAKDRKAFDRNYTANLIHYQKGEIEQKFIN